MHGPTLLQIERHEYLKSMFSVSVMSVETFAITLWKAGSLRGEIITFLSFKRNKLFHLQGLLGNWLISKTMRGGEGGGCCVWSFYHVPVGGHFIWGKDLRVERAVIKATRTTQTSKVSQFMKSLLWVT